MLKQTKYCLMLILAVMIVTIIGASVKNLNTNQYCYQEKNIKLGQTALLYRKHPFRITHVEMTTDLAKVFNQQEQRILRMIKQNNSLSLRQSQAIGQASILP
nr:hypothetical protein [Lacticaseibacillus rhamnosus]